MDLNIDSVRTLLIVDDEADLRSVLKRCLKGCADVILTAENGAVALELLSKHIVDAVLSDLSMPVMGGLQLLSHIREAGMDIPFVILTGHGDKSCLVDALRLGANDFIDKPFEPDLMGLTMKRAVELGCRLRAIQKALDQAYVAGSIPPALLSEMKQAKLELFRARRDLEISSEKHRQQG